MGLDRGWPFVLVLTVACGAGERPPAESDLATSVASTQTTEESDDQAGRATFAPICRAGETRRCTLDWWSKDGVHHCWSALQRCRDDEHGWQACVRE